jgi:DNA gyrase/topoisomerase IV subunit A
VPANGCLGIRLGKDDLAVAITSVNEESQVFMMSADGKGAIRLMNGFASNKTAGISGKVAMKTDKLIGALEVKDSDNIFAISRLSKIIRFQVIEVPPKEGVVQGVNCMALRADETMTITTGTLPQIQN